VDSDDRRWVFGLCADWCGLCKEWRAVFDAAAASHAQDRFAWIDIEDDDDLVGDVDIETFPTLLVGRAGQVLFFGPILPSPELLTRLLASLDESAKDAGPSASRALLQRLVSAQL
jgi:protein-disulfide isomerase-like protein with CxxC motif